MGVASVQDRLEVRLAHLGSVVVEAAVWLAHAELTDSPGRDFVPVLVERA